MKPRKEPMELPRRAVLFFWFPLYFALAGLAFDATRPLSFVLAGEQSPASSHDWSVYVIANVAAGVLMSLFCLSPNRLIMLPLVGVPSASVGLVGLSLAEGGIITVTWHGVLGFFASLCLFLQILLLTNREPAHELLNRPELGDRGNEIVSALIADVWAVIGLVIKVFLGTAAITGVCMTILFRFGYQEIGPKANAIQIVIGFGLASGALYVWALAPALQMFVSLRALVSKHYKRVLVHRPGS